MVDRSRRRVLAAAGITFTAGCSAAPNSGSAPDSESTRNTDRAGSDGATRKSSSEAETDAGDDVESKSKSDATNSFDVGRSSWTQEGLDTANTRHSDKGSIPETVTEVWQVTGGLEIGDVLGTPLVSDGQLFIGCGKTLFNLATADGKTTWTTEFDTRIAAFSAALADDHLVVPGFVSGEPDGAIYGIGVTDATERWRIDERPASAPVIADDTVYIRLAGRDGATLLAVGLNGTERFRLDADGGPKRFGYAPRPAVADDQLFVPVLGAGDGEDRSAVMSVDVTSQSENWRRTVDERVTAAPVVSGGTVYVGSTSGTLYALNAATGAEQWTYSTGKGIRAAPAVAGEMVYTADPLNGLHAVDAETGEREWHVEASPGGMSPAVTDETVVVGGDVVLALDAATGTERWTFDLDGLFSTNYTAPALLDGGVATASCTKEDSDQRQYDNYVHLIA
jgi:outer membrane protein assembly factor BamB